ncbi:MAG: SIMPL domain-containing protein [Desulfofustis sp.]
MKIILMIVTAATVALSSFAHADDTMQFNIVNLTAEQSRQVKNDVMVAVMQATAEKNNSAEAAQAVNKSMAWADTIISASEQIRYRSLNYQTRPVYRDRIVTGWTASQQVRLESEDIEALTAMIGTLQQQLQVVSMDFAVSAEKRKQELETLIVAALEAFNHKAEMISQTMQARDYRLVSMTVNENGAPVVYRGAIQAEAMSAQAMAPQVEAGDSKITVRIAGSIQLIY